MKIDIMTHIFFSSFPLTEKDDFFIYLSQRLGVFLFTFPLRGVGRNGGLLRDGFSSRSGNKKKKKKTRTMLSLDCDDVKELEVNKLSFTKKIYIG